MSADLSEHRPIDALHTPTGRVVKVCAARDCETEDGDFVRWPCPALREINRMADPI